MTILATISLQIYWNIKNYHENELRLVSDVQVAFDNSIEHYYIEDAKNTFVSFVGNGIQNISKDTAFRREFRKSHSLNRNKKISSIGVTNKNQVQNKTNHFAKAFVVKNTLPEKSNEKLSSPSTNSTIKIVNGKRAVDSLSKIEKLANKIIISMLQDSIELNKIAKVFDQEIFRKNIDIKYKIQQIRNDTVIQNFPENKSKLDFKAFGNSSFLPQDQKLKIEFSNPTILILKRSMMEIVLSLLLSLSIIFCLLYLLKTINRQKKIDEMKNDLISNITHEFKTPITTVSTALEGIKSFNLANDPEKTTRYIDISNQQLKKLEIMVEKLLETASLETDKILLNKESIDLVELLRSNIEKHEMNSFGHQFNFESDSQILMAKIDLFHFENAISNIIDNAVKYGGNEIIVSLKKEKNNFEILIEDNGKGIDKREHEKIFDKFYRIQKGNIHDVKGFGIGLYYSKKIIEKHDGKIELFVNSKTVFKITIPNE